MKNTLTKSGLEKLPDKIMPQEQIFGELYIFQKGISFTGYCPDE
tara:strand:+ start:510 stop:641 length:132 start_codon:yes stop_codon:yes gene_type:complete